MTENKGELTGRMSWKNLMFRCVMYDLTVEKFTVSRMNLFLLRCNVVPMKIAAAVCSRIAVLLQVLKCIMAIHITMLVGYLL